MKKSFVIFLKQLFCRHIYKEIKEEFLRKAREPHQVGDMTHYLNYNYYSVHKTCIKCDKSIITQRRELLI